MMRKRKGTLAGRTLLQGALLLALTACAQTPGPVGSAAPEHVGKCLALFSEMDDRIDAAGVADAGFARIPGAPFLRIDRYSASFTDEIADTEMLLEWVGQLSANEDVAREAELQNLGLSRQARAELRLEMRACASLLRAWMLEDPAAVQELLTRAKPIDAYSDVARALGVFPISKVFLKRGVAEFQRGVEAEFAQPLDALELRGEMRLWQVRTAPDLPAKPLRPRDLPRDRLGRPGMLWSDTEALARHHAPMLWIDTAGDHDRPGMPVHGPGGPDVDVSNPVVYFLPALTRFGGESLLQINYFAWFSDRPPEGLLDPEAGKLDGLIWRVTLDKDGTPLFYDTIHACGCYHYGFPVQGLQRRKSDTDHAILLPQAEVPSGPVALRLASGTHALQRVVPADVVQATEPSAYELRPYEELLTLPHGEGSRSLFDPEGFIAGTERSERWWLWVSGVRNAGAMRQWGHHVTSFTGEAYFDDPFLLEMLFVAPFEQQGVIAGDPG